MGGEQLHIAYIKVQPPPLPHHPTLSPHLVSAHAGHHDIEQDHVGHLGLLLQDGKGLLAVHGLSDLVGGGEV